MHTTTITKADRAAMENLWGDAGVWVADTWTRLNEAHFAGQLRYHGIVWGLTPHGHRLGHTYETGRITPQLGLLPIKAAPVKPRRINGTVVSVPLDGHLTRSDISRWPYSIRPPGYFDTTRRVPVPI